MLVLGISAGSTQSGKRLKDGGLCIIEDGHIVVATAEERFSRIKHDGGFSQSLSATLEALNLELDDFDKIVISSCCENVPKSIQSPGILKTKDPTKISYIPSHHLSHAYSTFFVSPFEESLIFVMDAGGNILDSGARVNWWENQREQNSYYIGQEKDIQIIGRDFEQPLEVGFGEAYRAFTYYLGWQSHTLSANTMALAAYGDEKRYSSLKLFDFDGQKLRSRMVNNPVNPIEMVTQFARSQNISIPKPRDPNEPLSKDYMDLASFVQSELEKALVAKITYLVKKTGIRNLCIAGGVGLNCVANRSILDKTPIEEIFIQPASGDTGQALGNALYAHYALGGQPLNGSAFSDYLGLSYDLSFETLTRVFRTRSQNIHLSRLANTPLDVAEMLCQGKIVAWYQGRSEYGPRALGNRSILADPRRPALRQRCHEIKKRESFRPFAPSILENRASDYFYFDTTSPFMLLVAKAKPEKAAQIPGVLHTDSTARLHTVSKSNSPIFYELIRQFERITGIPLLLNTSFNKSNEPIVETPIDALNAFLDMDLDALVIGDVLVERIQEILAFERKPSVEYNWSTFDRSAIIQRLSKEFPGYKLIGLDVVAVSSEHEQLIHRRKKSTFIHYRPQSITYPITTKLRLLRTGSNGRKFDPYPSNEITVRGLTVKTVGLLNDEDAIHDGFEHKDELFSTLRQTYGDITDSEPVTIYYVGV
jgi:carbamoyltransferase